MLLRLFILSSTNVLYLGQRLFTSKDATIRNKVNRTSYIYVEYIVNYYHHTIQFLSDILCIYITDLLSQTIYLKQLLLKWDNSSAADDVVMYFKNLIPAVK